MGNTNWITTTILIIAVSLYHTLFTAIHLVNKNALTPFALTNHYAMITIMKLIFCWMAYYIEK